MKFFLRENYALVYQYDFITKYFFYEKWEIKDKLTHLKRITIRLLLDLL